MPIYEYICLECGEKFSLLRSIHATENDITCSRCKSKEIKKVLSAFSCAAGSAGGFSSSFSGQSHSGGG